jgi:hypothetical protein
VFDGDDLKDMPFYVVSGNHDHYVDFILWFLVNLLGELYSSDSVYEALGKVELPR